MGDQRTVCTLTIHERILVTVRGESLFGEESLTRGMDDECRN